MEENNEPNEVSWIPHHTQLLTNKRAWDKLQAAWGKRGWQNLHGTGWGKRSAMNDDPLSPYYLIPVPSYAVRPASQYNGLYRDEASSMDKRAWQNLNSVRIIQLPTLLFF